MPIFRFAKLVRDRIITHQIASGAKPTYRLLNDGEHKKALVDKIIEETSEIYTADNADIVAEIADVQQAIDDLKRKCGLTSKEIATAQALKNSRNGTFSKGIFIDHVEIDENDPWVAYYRKHSDRYPEIE